MQEWFHALPVEEGIVLTNELERTSVKLCIRPKVYCRYNLS